MTFPTRDCPTVEELTAYVDQQVAARDRRRVETHLTRCGLCRNDVAELFAVIGLLGGLDGVAPRRSLRIGPAPSGGSRDEPPAR